MPRRKAAQHVNIKPWLSARSDCSEGRFVQIGNTLLLSKSFQELSTSAQMLYICLAMESGGKPFAKLSRGNAKKYGFSPATYSRAVKQLIQAGFVKIAEDTGRYESNKFQFINDWKSKTPVSF